MRTRERRKERGKEGRKERTNERRRELEMDKHSFYFSIFPKGSLNHGPFNVSKVAVMQIALDFNKIIWGVAACEFLPFP